MPATHRADARKKIVWSVLLFGIVTCLNLFLPKLWPSGAMGLYYGSGVVVHWTMALRPFRDVPVQVVDISNLVDPTSGKFDRFKLAKLVNKLSEYTDEDGKPKIRGLAIDNDFSRSDRPELPGERDLFRALIALQDQGRPVAVGVMRALDMKADDRFYGSDPSDHELSKSLKSLQAAMYLRPAIVIEEGGSKILGPHWAPVEHDFRIEGGKRDVLPSLAGRLVPKDRWDSAFKSFWFETGHTLTHEGTINRERVIDLGLIGVLERRCLRADNEGNLPVASGVSGGRDTAHQRQFKDKYVILAAVDDPEPNDKFNIAGFGTTSGGVVQAAAIASLMNGPMYELTTEGGICVDLLTTVLIAVIAHAVVRKRPRRQAAEHRIEMSWTMLVIFVTLFVSVLLAWIGSILWYHSMNFVAGHVMLLVMSWIVTRNPKRFRTAFGRFVRYWFLGEGGA